MAKMAILNFIFCRNSISSGAELKGVHPEVLSHPECHTLEPPDSTWGRDLVYKQFCPTLWCTV